MDTSGNLQVYHTDGPGSVRAITNGSGNLVEAYLTDAFGVALGTEGTVTQPFGFTGQQQDSESGLYYLRARYYSPTLGMFISRDPTFGAITNPLSLNRFGYALDNLVLTYRLVFALRTPLARLGGRRSTHRPVGCRCVDR